MELRKIYNEGCMETMRRMKDNFIDLTVTSPPYDNLRTYNDNIDETWGEDVWKPIIKELYRVTKEGGVVVWVSGDRTKEGDESGTSFRQALHAKKCGFKLHDTMIYKKPPAFSNDSRYSNWFEFMFVFSKGKIKTFNPIKDYKCVNTNKSTTSRKKDGSLKKDVTQNRNTFAIRGNIWEYAVGMNGTTSDKVAFKHPAMFPEDLCKDHIKSWSNEGDLVYDPFMGSGTIAKMAHLLKRKWIGSEISSEYVELANKRLQPYISQKTLF